MCALAQITTKGETKIMKKSEIYEVTHSCYSEILSDLESRMSVDHWSYTYLREKAEECQKNYFDLLERGLTAEAEEELRKHSEAMEKVDIRVNAYANIYKVVAKYLGLNVD